MATAARRLLQLGVALHVWLALAFAEPVRTSSEFMAALATACSPTASDTTIEVDGDLELSAADVANYSLPLALSDGHTLRIAGGGSSVHFGGSSDGAPILVLQAGSALVLDGLNMSGTASPAAAHEALLTSLDALPMWPTISPEAGASLTMANCSILMNPSPLCTPKGVTKTAAALEALAGGDASVSPSGLSATFLAFQLPLNVANTSGGCPAGVVEFALDGTTLKCTPMPPAAPATASAPGPAASDDGAALTATRVATPAQLMAALSAASEQQGPGGDQLVLEAGIALTTDAAAGYKLPLYIAPDRTLALVGGGGMRSLDFGGIPELLYMEEGSRLVLDSLNISGSARSSRFGAPSEQAGDALTAPTASITLALFPTVNGGVNFKVASRNINMTVPGGEACTPEHVYYKAQTLQQVVAEATGTLTADGTTIIIKGHLATSAPVLNVTSGAQVGTMHLEVIFGNITCIPAAASSTASSDADTSDAGAPAWVWAVVGVCGAGVAAAAVGVFVWHRRAARRQHAEQAALSGHTSTQGDLGGSCSESQPNSGSEHAHRGSSDSERMRRASNDSMQNSMWKSRVGFIDGLQLGPVLGGGGYGRVYRARWRGTMVAVKVVPTQVAAGSEVDLGLEPLLSMSLSHPNILQAFKTCVVKVLGSSCAQTLGGGCGASASARVLRSLTDRNCLVEMVPSLAVLEPGMYEMFMVCELADQGPMADALANGTLKAADGSGQNMHHVLLCLLDIARGLEYLHALNIVHGDLKLHNVLLKSEKHDGRGYVCKLCDFGLSRMLGEQQTHVETSNYGTASHAAPELLSEGRLTKASDIYALGVIIWELTTGQRILPGAPAMQIISLVAMNGWRPPIPDTCPPLLADLICRCWQADPSARPGVEAVAQALKEYAVAYVSAARGLAPA